MEGEIEKNGEGKMERGGKDCDGEMENGRERS